MEFDSEPEFQPQMAGHEPDKRSASPLFYTEDGSMDSSGDASNKRQKVVHAEAQSKKAPQNPALTTNGMVPGYKASSHEAYPRLAIYHSSFRLAEDLVTEVCDAFCTELFELKLDGYLNPEIDVICEGGHGLLYYRVPHDRYPLVGTVGCLGPSGVGKSSFVNSMLDQKKAALENDSDRGTYVVHEYMRPLYNQTSVFEILVPYLPLNQIRRLVEKQHDIVTDYRDHPNDLDDGEEDELRAKFDTALDFFCALLCNRQDFASVDDAEEFFLSKKDDANEYVVELLHEYIEIFLKTRNINDGYESFTAETETELNDVFKKVSRPSKARDGMRRQPSPWPLITKVQICQSNKLLNADVILADTAGVTDTNQTVVQNTQRYLKQASTVLIFSGHKRIEKDPLVDQHLRQCIQLGKINNLALVVTMIDTKELYKDTEKEDLPPAEKALLDQAEGRVAAAQAEEVKLIGERDEASDKDFRAIQTRLNYLQSEIALAANAVKQIAVQIRCREIREKMKGRLGKLNNSKYAPELPIHFISSAAYQKHVDGYNPRQPPTLDLEGTGIPALRRMLYDVPARGKINTLSRICTSRLPNIFNGILGVLTKSKLERKGEVEKLIIKILAGQESLVDGIVAEVKEKFTLRILSMIKENEANWKEAAKKLSDSWAKLKSATFLAFCRRSGHWKLPGTATQDMLSWNAMIDTIFDAKLVAAFDLLIEEDLDDMESAVAIDLSQLLKKLESELLACEDFQGVNMEPFFEYIRGARDHMMTQMARLFNSLRDNVKNIRHSATLDTEKSYVALAMQDTYQDCLLMQAKNYDTTRKSRRVHRGGRAHDQRTARIGEKLLGIVDRASIFISVGRLANEEFETVLTSWGTECRDMVGNGCKSILEDFSRRYTVSEDTSEGDVKSAKRLQDAAHKALGVIHGEIKEHIERCEAYENDAS
ncbi:hypothetical protein LTR08_001114 [Meristemomyces frigidus]|nr:hypothetical protein LTR08_001114 [Meristemomyces frigidus]